MEGHSGGIYGLELRAVCVPSADISSPSTLSHNPLHSQRRQGNAIQLHVQESGKQILLNIQQFLL